MKCKWIIENFTDSEDYRDLIKNVRDSGRECFVIGRHNHFDFDPSGYNEGDCVIVQGSIQMTKNIRNRLPQNCFPIAYNSWEKYYCSAYYSDLDKFLFNDRRKFFRVKELQENKFEIYCEFGKEALIFIRPDSGDKPFSGQLLDLQDFDRFWNNAVACSAKDEDIVIVSTPKIVTGEWRFVCSKYNRGEIIASSTYMFQGQKTLIPSAPFGAIALCEEVLNVKYFPDSVFCVDICQDADGDYWLLELTSFSSAGLYAADKKKIVDRVSEIAEYEWVARNSVNRIV